MFLNSLPLSEYTSRSIGKLWDGLFLFCINCIIEWILHFLGSDLCYALRDFTHKKVVFVSGRTTMRGEGINPLEPLRKQSRIFYDFKKKWTRTSWNTNKINKNKLHVMFSAGKYRSTEKAYEKVSENIIFSNLNSTEFFVCFKPIRSWGYRVLSCSTTIKYHFYMCVFPKD